MRLKQLLKDYNVKNEFDDAEISGIAYDSRKVKPGDVFVCISGFETDGHKYAAKAVEKGAAAVIAEHAIDVAVPTAVVEDTRHTLSYIADVFYGHPSGKFRLVGVTGTNGKTTTTFLVKSILEKAGHKVGLIGTNKNMIGEKELPSERTTPESLELTELFAEMAKEGADFVVMEVSSHSLSLSRVEFCEFDVGAFTNLTQDHLDFHKTMENYLAAKKKLFDMCKTGVINADDESGRKILADCSCVSVSYGIDSAADIVASNIDYGAHGVDFDCDALGVAMRIHINTPGRFSVYNALAAVGICTALGISAENISAGLKSVPGVCGRAEIVPTGRDYTVMIDYAHTPDGIENILKSIRGFAKGRIVILFGCGGDRDRTKRPKMGRIAGELADFCVVTSDNPRTEEPGEIIKEIIPGVEETGCPYTVIENRKEAIRYALDNAETGDVILLAGKGHETYQILKSGKIHFDEREIVHEILGEEQV
ncbi:MAG: UDP-N-acetylmuramoyl-L-alanyl-D-glutamate--2,6-diaminopimelate ligase [Clostridia bacterium]|nr:UDP-N-acetylmuramoyl-L-alanyl-D-glutamate--2,6-diaminopimelate ligase [Clostridia bacterium]